MNKTIIALAILMASFATDASVLSEALVPFKGGTGVIDNDTIYIGLGSAGTTWYKLGTQAKDKRWAALTAFPGKPRDQAIFAFIDGNLYVFDGIGKDSEGLTQVFNDIHKYNPETNSWVKLMLRIPMSMTGHATLVHNGKAYVTDGVNQNIFNGYFEDLSEARKDSTAIDRINVYYFDKEIEDYLFNKFLLSLDPSTQRWSHTDESPWYGMVDAAVVNKGDRTWLTNGEAKPGLRTDAVSELGFTDNNLKWNKLALVISPNGAAGGFVGMSNDSLILAGGAGFKGSRENYQNGKNYAREGLRKSYSADIHLWHSGKRDKSGELSQGRAYGAPLLWDNSLLVIDGRAAGGKAVTSSVLISVKDDKVTVQD